MKIFKEYLQDQHFLLPPSLEEFVVENHEVRIINDIVDTMELSPLLVKYEGGGAPAYHPTMMLKVIVYAYSQSIYSSRKIAQELKTNTAFMFLSGLQTPDFRTICLFRAQNADVLPELFVEAVRLCASLGMIGLGHIAFDGTKLKANASVERIKEEMRQMIQASAQIDEIEDLKYPNGDGSEIKEELRKKEYRLKKLQEAREVLEKEKLEKVNVTEPDSRLMKDRQKLIRPSYNGQIAVDDKDQIIVAAAIIQDATDNAQFKPMVEQVEKNVGSLPEESSADSGYFSFYNLEYAATKHLDVYIPDSNLKALDKKEAEDKRYDKSNFHYDEGKNTYVCPEGKELRQWAQQKREGKALLNLYRGVSCQACAVIERCTQAKARLISHDGREPLLEAMRQKLRSEEGKEIYKKRAYTVEPVFGEMKWDGRKLSMYLRGFLKVQGEFSLMCLVHNIKKVIKKVLEGKVSLHGKHEELVAATGNLAERLALACAA